MTRAASVAGCLVVPPSVVLAWREEQRAQAAQAPPESTLATQSTNLPINTVNLASSTKAVR